jgi:hypothetical protein
MFLKFVKKSVLGILMFSSYGMFSQNIEQQSIHEKKIDMGFEGMIGVSFNKETIGINVGGPSLKFKFNKNYKIGVGAFPSLVIIDKKVYPKLGVSPILEYKNWMFIAPYYGYDNKDKLIWTFGLGYRFF